MYLSVLGEEAIHYTGENSLVKVLYINGILL